ncbi:MAG: pilus assembly protein PilM [Clostridiaceae bacterium]|nr:pilus assembly protein PilM [Clostridiaceae bacterium]
MRFYNNSVIGLEADSKEIRAVELKGTRKKPVIAALGSISIPEGIVRDGRILDIDKFNVYLQKLIEQNGFKAREVVIGVNNQDVIVRFATFPKVPQDKIRNMIRFQAQDYIPIPLEELQLDYVVLGEEGNDSGAGLNVLLVGARKKMLNDFIEAVSKSNLTITEIDSTMLALGRAALLESNDGNFALITFNNDIGNIMIFNNGFLAIARTVSFSNTLLNQPDFEDAEDTLDAISDILLGEVRTSVNYFRSQTYQDVARFCILGTSTYQNAVAEKLSLATGLSFEVLEPYKKLEESISKGKGKAFNLFGYVAAISLALRGLED